MSPENKNVQPNKELEAALLDLVFEECLESIAVGREPVVDQLLKGHQHLQGEACELLRVARRVAQTGYASFPVIGGYEILSELGRGAMGSVYLARREFLGGRPVALKLLPEAASLSCRARERFLREARSLARIRHHNVVPIHEIIDRDGILAYAMEWVEGATLGELLQAIRRDSPADRMTALAKQLDSRELRKPGENYTVFVVRVAVGVARALAELHRHGLRHRDVKPSNILVRPDGTPMLSDFGLVRDIEDQLLTRSGEFLGTMAYAPPEQLSGELAAIDARSDIYSLGVTVYHALALDLPFRPGSTAEALRAIETGSAPSLRTLATDVPRDLEVVVHKAMDPDSLRRYQSSDEFADDLERLLRLEPVQARRVGVMTRALRLIQRRREQFVAGAIGIIVTLVLGIGANSYVQNLPFKVALAHQQAQMELFDSDNVFRLYSSLKVRNEGLPTRSFGGTLPEKLESARGAYRSALSLDPLGLTTRSKQVALELSLIETAISVSGDSTDHGLSCDQLERNGFPLTARLAREWVWDGPEPAFVKEDFDAASPEDRTAAGLFAYMCGAANLMLKALEVRTVESLPNALADGALGEANLLVGRPEIAVTFFANALAAAPSSAFFRNKLADCKLRLGDIPRARAILAHASGDVIEDAYHSDIRIRADLLRIDGNHGGAERLYREALAKTRTPDTYLHFSSFLLDHERDEEALDVLRQGYSRWTGAEMAEALRIVAETWWGRLSSAERLKQLRSAFDGERRVFGSLLDLVLLLADRELTTSLFSPSTKFSAEFATVAALTSSQGLHERQITDLFKEVEFLVMKRSHLFSLPSHSKDALSAILMFGGLPRQLVCVFATALFLNAPAAAQSKIFAFHGDSAGDQLGYQEFAGAGDTDGDGKAEILCGASRSDQNGTDAGYARLFSGATGLALWTGMGETQDHYGHSVAGIGDVNGDGFSDILVGAVQSSGGTGYADVVSGIDGTPIRTHIGLAIGDSFGTGLDSLRADFDGDGVWEYAIGANQLAGAGGSGYVQIFSGASGNLLATLSGDNSGDGFGEIVTELGDVDGDGWVDMGVGAITGDFGGKGNVSYVHVLSVRDLIDGMPAVIYSYAGAKAFDRMYKIAAAGDLNGDGRADILVGSWGRDFSGSNSGSVYAYSGMTGAEIFRKDGTSANEKLFWCDGLREDWDGDNLPDVIVSSEEGYALVLNGVTGSEIHTFNGLIAGDGFGYQVVHIGDADCDGVDDVGIGAWLADVGGTDTGTVTIFARDDLSLVASDHLLPIQKGNRIDFSLSAGSSHGDEIYWMFCSATGTNPGISFPGGVTLNLNYDALFQLTLTNPGLSVFEGFRGVLDATGRANAAFVLPAGTDPALAGITIHHAFVAGPVLGTVTFASNSVPFTLML